MESGKQLTYGQKAVGLSFNPSGDPEVTKMKQLYADVIDMMYDFREKTSSSEARRHASVAITEAESAQMRAVKALTWKDPVVMFEKAAESYKPVDFDKDVVAYSKIVPVVLDFFTVRCGPCINLKEPMRELADKMGFGLVMINCDHEAALCRQFEVRSVPRLIVYSAGQPVWDSNGKNLMSTQARVDAIAAVVKEYQGK